MTAPKPEQGGWWEDFVHNMISPLEGPNPGAFKGLEQGITNYGHKVAGNIRRDFIDPMKTAEGRLQWLQDWTTPGPGEMGAALGAVGRKAAAKKALEKLRAAAVRSEDGKVFTAPSHAFAFADGEDAGALFSGHADDEGFIHPTKGYITRRQAKEMGYFAKSEKDVPQTVQVAEAGDSPMLLEALEKNGGFTYDPYSSSFVESGGVMVGGTPGQKGWKGKTLSPEALEKFRADNAKLLSREGMFVGGWKDEDGVIHLDVSERVPRDKAEALIKERGEKAGWDLDANAEVRSPEVPKSPKVAKKQKRIEEGTPNDEIRSIADAYNARTGLSPIRRFDPVKHDEPLAREVAEWYEKAQDAPDDAEVKAAYEAFNKETADQYDELVKQGWKFSPTEDAVLDAYPGAAEMRFDAANKRLKVFTGGEPNKLMTPEQNYKFRAVHDVMAHTSEGYDFHPDGEWNAALKHSQMYSPKAQRALFTETVGQNANLNYGPNGEFNRANPGKEIFPQQKATLLPQGFADRLTSGTQPPKKIESPAVHIPKEEWKPERLGVFDFSPEGGVPATEYREPAPLPFESAPRPRAGPSELAQRISTSKKVEKRIIADMEKGLPLGGRGWYGTLPLRRYFESIGKPEGFADFNNAGGAGSIRTPTHNELTNISLLRYANKRGIPYEEARAEFFKQFPGTMKPTFMGIHGKVYDRSLAAGKMIPSSPSAGELKVPHYTHDRNLGATGVPLDTHELRAMAQSLGIDEDLVKTAAVDAESYNLMTAPYRRIAKRFGLHPDQVQAGRWIGGGKETGLKSQPKGDFMQTLEDGLLYTARSQGRDESPKGLRSLWDAIAAGDEFFMPYGGEGGFPVR